MGRGSAVGALPVPTRQPERVPPIQRSPSRIHVAVTTSAKYFTLLFSLWERVQTSHCGQYSVERMRALDEYCQRVSLLRVVMVCAATPIPTLTMVLLAECLPLRPPAEGALANYVFWLRHASMVALILLGVVVNAKAWIPDVPLTRRRIIGLSLGCSLVATALDVVVAHLWVFPIPFLTVLGGPVLLTIVVVALVCVVGLKALREIEDGGFHAQRYVNILSVQTSTMTIYPAYHALFVVAPESVKRLLVVLLPAVTLALKNAMVAHASHLEDRLPEVVVFSVDFFDAMYSVLCMRSASSLSMIAITVAMNSLVLTLSLKGMARRAEFAQGSWTTQWRQPSSAEDTSPMAATLTLLQTPGKLDPSELNRIRLFSGGELALSEAGTALLNTMAARAVYNTDRKAFKMISISQLKARYALAAIAGPRSDVVAALQPRPKLPVHLQHAVKGFSVDSRRLSNHFERLRSSRVSSSDTVKYSSKDATAKRIETAEEIDLDSFHQPPETLVRAFTPPRTASSVSAAAAEVLDASFKLRSLILPTGPGLSDILQRTRAKNTRTVNGALQLLFNNEYLGLIAYTQCVIPIMYMAYMAVLQALPNRVYYPEARNVGDASRLGDRMLVVGVLGLCQFVSLLALHKLVAARFSVSTLYQIAFVLETQVALVQGKVASSFIFAVGFPLEHYGKLAVYGGW
jgi:hypothetical protein